MLHRPVLAALAGGPLALSLACGGSFGTVADPHWSEADIRSVAAAQGWTVDDCSRDRYGRAVDITCTLERGETFATVLSTNTGDTGMYQPDPEQDVRVEGQSILHVVVSDGRASEALLGTLVPVGTPIEEVSRDALVAKLTQAGWAVTESSDAFEGGERYAYLVATRGDQRAEIDVVDGPGTSTEEERDASGGFAELYRGDDSVSITVDDRAAARALLAGFGG